ncbi:Glucosidase YgjK precursor [Hartmannibacter diazotrophicus]|uniref:Glucosidase YgjK n=1 Tax=Hartmannibacter diazotrophicus TaxID=1482074 RepID=A0A2C9D909_9HYPH|nr:trehalase family glycosidase [Hartmannibacter diazotrophicus]SON56787.1 Glucosidase YgjK precursor [Hartmannibacter diazotrophicus]
MTRIDRSAAFERARSVMLENDRGSYTIPTKGLYPFQWNWDSCLTALGQRHFDEDRAFTEIETLLAHQWPDGMVPHIVFHVDDEGYFPGPGVWRTGRPTPTSGITQPPVLAFVLRRLVETCRETAKAEDRARAMLPKANAWHEWFYAMRDPKGEGLVAILHPWESGRDNSIDWDEALAGVPTEGVEPYVRRDTTHVDASHRPHRSDYDRYMWLVQRFRSLGWDNAQLHDASPFQVVDPGFNAILIRADEDLASLARRLGASEIAEVAEARVAKARKAFARLWSEKHGQFVCLNRVAGKLVDSASVGGLLPLLAGLGTAQQQGLLAKRIREWRARSRFGVASHDPADPRFEPKRYWRGPVWIIVNYLLIDGLRRCGLDDVAGEVVADSMALIEESGFAEYYDPTTGEGLGGGNFTWTAAIIAELLTSAEA